MIVISDCICVYEQSKNLLYVNNTCPHHKYTDHPDCICTRIEQIGMWAEGGRMYKKNLLCNIHKDIYTYIDNNSETNYESVSHELMQIVCNKLLGYEYKKVET